MNRSALLHAVSVVLSALLLSLCILVELAARLSPGRFALVAWLLLGVSGLVATLGVTRLWRSWVSAKTAPVVIDRRAGLQDRLTTLLSVGPDAHASRLWNYLRDENQRLRPRWTPVALVPHFAPPSIWLLGIALLLSLYSVWQAPGRKHSRALRSAEPSSARAPAASTDGETTPGEEASAGEDSSWSELPQELQQAILGSESSDEMQGKAPQKTSPVENEIPGSAAIVDQSMKSPGGPVRSVPADSKRPAGSSGAGQQPTGSSPDPSKPKEGVGAPAPSTPMRGDAPRTLAPEKGRALSPQNKKLDKKQPSPTGLGGAGSAGAGSGGDQDGLFGEKQAIGGGAGAFSLDLDAMRGGDEGKGEGDGAAHHVDSALAPNQRVDDAIRRAQVPAEYEGIVQRLFNRSTDDADRPQGTR